MSQAVRRLGTAGALFAALAAAPTTGRAQVVSYAGFTNGCFGLGCVPVTTSVYQTALLAGTGLSFQNSVFSGSTLGGFAGIGNVATPVGVQNVDNLGSFNLTSAAATYTGSNFTLGITFTAPGSSTQLFTAAIFGAVRPRQGGVFIDFNNTPQSFSYVRGTMNGVATLFVNDVSITAPASGQANEIAISGNLTLVETPNGQSTPEPAVLALVGPGLLAIGGFARRRARPAAT